MIEGGDRAATLTFREVRGYVKHLPTATLANLAKGPLPDREKDGLVQCRACDEGD